MLEMVSGDVVDHRFRANMTVSARRLSPCLHIRNSAQPTGGRQCDWLRAGLPLQAWSSFSSTRPGVYGVGVLITEGARAKAVMPNSEAKIHAR